MVIVLRDSPQAQRGEKYSFSFNWRHGRHEDILYKLYDSMSSGVLFSVLFQKFVA